MRVVGVVNNKPLHILIDSGSTHNFVDLSLAQKIGCTIESIPDQAITVSDGNQIVCNHRCVEFVWTMNNKSFVAEVMLIPLGGCDMVLGVQWLSTLGKLLGFSEVSDEF